MSAGRPAAEPGSDTAAALYVALGRLVRDLRRSAGPDGPAPIGPSATAALMSLSKVDKGLRMGELAELEGVSAPSMTRIVHTLDELGLVGRGADPRDARCQVISLTDAGIDLVRSGRESRTQLLRERIAALGEAERESLVAALPALEALTGRVPAPTP